MAISGLPRMTRISLRSMPALVIHAPWLIRENSMNPLGPTWGSTRSWYSCQFPVSVATVLIGTSLSPMSSGSAS
ncbi:hypothetical protein AWC20_06450 [Mycobacterium parmense]|nr:hypothetical protein AWC20_06450 [Mycobacterium parmense]